MAILNQIFKLGDTPQTSDVNLNLYLTQLKRITTQLSGKGSYRDRAVTLGDLVDLGLVTPEQIKTLYGYTEL